MLFNDLARRRQSVIRNGYKLVVLLPVCCRDEQLVAKRIRKDEEMSMYGLTSSMTMPLESAVYDTAYTAGERTNDQCTS